MLLKGTKGFGSKGYVVWCLSMVGKGIRKVKAAYYVTMNIFRKKKSF